MSGARPIKLGSMTSGSRYFSGRLGLSDFMSGGPYAPVLDELASRLEQKGYAVTTVRGYLRGARHVTFCMERRQLTRAKLTLGHLRHFARTHGAECRCPHAEKSGAKNFYTCVLHLLPILQRAGLAPQEPNRPFADILVTYNRYMEEVKGLTRETRALQVKKLRQVFAAVMPSSRFDPSRLKQERLNAYILTQADARVASTVRGTVTALRGFLRYMRTQGHDVDLALACIRAPRDPRPLYSRKALTTPQLRALLLPLRGKDPASLRDLAVVLLLAQAGLRRRDISMLTLDHFNARQSTLVVPTGKSRQDSVVALPTETRDAILEYIGNGRRSVSSRALFLAHAFPYNTPITVPAVTSLVLRAFLKSGVKHVSMGTHVLRHTFATRLVAARQPLKMVADAMRHKSIDTTVGYFRIDFKHLKRASMPWPAGGHANV